MPSRRRWIGVCLVCVAAGLGATAIARNCARLSQLAPAVVGAMPTLIELLTATAGVLLVVDFWPGRVGRGLYCKSCGYHQEGRGRLAPACPECGAKWLWIGNTRRGWRTGALPPVLLGVGLCLLALGGSVIHGVKPWFYLRLLPTPVLVAQVLALPDDSTGELWAEVDRRKLPVPTLDAMADLLLKKKARDGYLSRPAEVVVFNAMMRPTAPAASAARYFASFLSAVVQAPGQVEQEERIVCRARVMFRGHTLTLGSVPRVVAISAIYLGDSTEPLQTWTWDVDPESPRAQTRDMDGYVTASEPGLVRLRQEFWLAIGPPNAQPITWQDGVPVPPAVMSIKDHFEEVREVLVTPRPREKEAGSVPPG